jgi:asparagine synthase (glutamine-hydrolysing)
MCGIAGVFDATVSPAETRSAIERMAGALVHRGPDDLGIVIDEDRRAGLACRRLSLVGITNGHQPVSNEDGTVSVVFNGEIYNHRALRRRLSRAGHRFTTDADTEVIVHLYEERGLESFAGLDGMFAIAVLDRRRGRLVLARDGCGMKQLCYARTPGGFVFASEAKALFASEMVRARPDWAALDTYLAVGYVPAPRSCFAGVHKLGAGTYVVVDAGGLQERTFWRLRYAASGQRLSDDEYGRRLEHILRAAVASHTDADTRVGAFLSGGWDSSILAAMAAEVVPGPLATFSVVFPESPGIDESRFSRLMAQHIGSEHREIEFRASDVPRLLPDAVWHREEPFTGPGLPEFQVASLASRHVKAVLSGQGSDELFGGYPWQTDGERWYRLRAVVPPLAARLAAKTPLRTRWRLPLAVLGAPDPAAADAEWMRSLTPAEKNRLFRRGLRQETPDAVPFRCQPETLASCRDPFQRRAALDFTRRLTDGILVTGDRMAMAHSLEVRMPFLDRTVVDYAAALPTDLKVRAGQEKYVLRHLTALLPPEIASRRKFGLQYPLAEYLLGTLQPFVRELLLDSPFAHDCLDRHAIDRMLRRWLTREPPELRAPWSLVVLAAWWNRFMASN